MALALRNNTCTHGVMKGSLAGSLCFQKGNVLANHITFLSVYVTLVCDTARVDGHDRE